MPYTQMSPIVQNMLDIIKAAKAIRKNDKRYKDKIFSQDDASVAWYSS